MRLLALAVLAMFGSPPVRIPTEGLTMAQPFRVAAHANPVPKPKIVWTPIPFGAKRKAETVAYTRRHYGSFLKPTLAAEESPRNRHPLHRGELQLDVQHVRLRRP